MTGEHRSAKGATLVEVVVASLLLLVILAAVFTLFAPSNGILRTQPEVIDLQQRIRVGVDMLRRDLLMAGAGAYTGDDIGSLVRFLAPILPRRQGLLPTLNDAPGAFVRTAVTLLFVSATPSQTTLASPTDFNLLAVNTDPGCPVGQTLCGFREGMQGLLFDRHGAFDTVTVTRTLGASAEFENNRAAPMSRIHPAGTRLVEMKQRVYYLDAGANRLMVYDGHRNAVPVLDNVVSLAFQYYGDPDPPRLRRPEMSQATTYGPEPPRPDQTATPWPTGENCTFQNVEGTQQPRLAALGPADGSLVELSDVFLTDGPWCPDESSPNRYDADLLRIRRVRVTLRVQTGDDGLRGVATGGPDSWFLRSGTAMSLARSVPDQTVQFDVSPRNLNSRR